MDQENKIGLIERMVIQMGLNKAFNAIDGSKTYIIAGLGVVIVLAGHFWGPFSLAGGTVPKESWNDVWQALQASGIVASIRHGISKVTPSKI